MEIAMSITSAQETQQQPEQRYRLMIEEASDGIFIMDYDARYIDGNNRG
jgi:PAS domain-containing protein